MKTLEEFVKENSVATFYNHEPFAKAGTITTLTPKKAYCGYVAAENDALVARVLKAAKESSVVDVAWCLEASGGKVTPSGLAIVVTKQVIATPVYQRIP